MEITIDLTRHDYSEFHNHWAFKKERKKLITLTLIFALCFPIISHGYDGLTITGYLFLTLIGGLIFSLCFFFFLKFAINNNTKKLLDDGAILGKKKYILNSENFIEESDKNRSTYEWSAIKNLEINKNLQMLYIDTNTAFIIPRRAFSDSNQENKFAEFISEKIKSSHNIP